MLTTSLYWRLVVIVILILCAALPAAVRNVTSYGAVADDLADDLAAIRSAIAASASGDTVFFPAGTYCVTGPFSPKSGTTVLGAVPGPSVIKFTGSAVDGFVDMSGRSDVEIGYLTLDGSGAGIATCEFAVKADNCSRLFLHHLVITDIGNFGDGMAAISFPAAVTDSRIADNRISNIGPATVWGGGIRCSWGSVRDTIVRNVITRTGRGGIFGNDGSRKLVIRNNRVSGSGGEGLGIEIWGGCDSSIIEDNHIDHWLSVDNSSFCAIRRDTVTDTSGIFKFIGLELAVGTNDVYTDNIVDNGQKLGISVSGVGAKRFIFWGYNTIRRASTWGVQLQGETAGGLGQHYFYRNTFSEMPYNSPDAAYANQGHGFRFNDNCDNISLDENEIRANGGLGIQLSSQNNQLGFTNNTITNNGDASVETPVAGITDLEWSGNTVTGNGNNRQLTSRGFANKKPVADFSVPPEPVCGTPVVFTNTSSDTDGAVANVLWDFNDGLPTNEFSPSHVFDSAGVYRVTLLVWDGLGRGAHVEKSITVAKAGTAAQVARRPAGQGLMLSLAPNPMRSGTVASFHIPAPDLVSLCVFDIAGHKIRGLVQEKREAGFYTIKWDGTDARGHAGANGVYIFRLKTEKGTAQKAIFLQR